MSENRYILEVNIVIMGDEHMIWIYGCIGVIWRRFSYSIRSYCVTHLYYLFGSCAPHSHLVYIVCILVYYDYFKGLVHNRIDNPSKKLLRLLMGDDTSKKFPTTTVVI
jgi:hypothetical protein